MNYYERNDEHNDWKETGRCAIIFIVLVVVFLAISAITTKYLWQYIPPYGK